MSFDPFDPSVAFDVIDENGDSRNGDVLDGDAAAARTGDAAGEAAGIAAGGRGAAAGRGPPALRHERALSQNGYGSQDS